MNLIFPSSWDDDPSWRTHIFQRGRYTTNHIFYYLVIQPLVGSLFWIGSVHLFLWAIHSFLVLKNNQAGYPTELATLDPRKFWLILGLEHWACLTPTFFTCVFFCWFDSYCIFSGKNTKSYGKIHHFQWVNPLFLWSFSIAMFGLGFLYIFTKSVSSKWDLPWGPCSQPQTAIC